MERKKCEVAWGGCSRRHFLRVAGFTSAGVLAAARTALSVNECMRPIDAQQETMEKFLDALVPHEDEPSAPGLVDLCGLDYVYDPFYPVANLVPLIVLLLDGASLLTCRKRFKDVETPSEREAIVKDVLKAIPLGSAVAILKVPFFTDAYSTRGWAYIGFPGPSLGYPDSSCRKPFREDARAPKGYLP